MIIREANLEDALKIATVRVLSWQKAYRNLISDHYLDNLTIPERFRNGECELSKPNLIQVVFL
ncbi:hypothetical protein [Candidatus Lokiarchaeum ossiferum]|uniref:hypothetical protein n=1 Tax=Candidatus Lokiarchaeum ossiferum TaxID=2951803 RepID=UPI00352D32D9